MPYYQPTAEDFKKKETGSVSMNKGTCLTNLDEIIGLIKSEGAFVEVMKQINYDNGTEAMQVKVHFKKTKNTHNPFKA